MASLIRDAKMSIQGFMTMYEKDPRRTHASDELVAIWDSAFKSLDKNSFTFLLVMSFVTPDSIPLELFKTNNQQKVPADLKFCSDMGDMLG